MWVVVAEVGEDRQRSTLRRRPVGAAGDGPRGPEVGVGGLVGAAGFRYTRPAMNLATTISDGVLAVTALSLARALLGRTTAPSRRLALQAAAAGFGLIGAAAVCGALRFAGVDRLVDLHKALTDAATAMSMPMIGAAALALTWPLEWRARGWLRWTVALAALHVGAVLAGATALAGLMVGAIGTIGVVIAGLRVFGGDRRAGALLLAGAVVTLIAGLAVGSEGELGPFARIDVFHYLLAVADVCLAGGLLRVSSER
ncbi:MAG: hypothetical protein R3B09_26080 [Nannocystaceae bacterium]